MSGDLAQRSEWRNLLRREVAALSESYRPGAVDQDFVSFFYAERRSEQQAV